jgi:hypothetical protein
VDERESGLATARAETVVAGSAAAVVVLAFAELPPVRATASLLVYVGYRPGGRRAVDSPLSWAGIALLVGLVVAVV